MRKSLLLLAGLGLLGGFAGLALPATAESGGSCGISQAAAAPLDLNSIPAKPVAGRLAVRGVGGDDECDNVPVIGKTAAEGGPAVINADDNRVSHEGLGESDD